MYVLIYADDLVITGNSLPSIIKFKVYLGSCFHMTDLELLKYFLGIEIARNPSGIYLCQRKYTLEIIYETSLIGAKLVSTLLEPNYNLAKASGPFFDKPDQYRRLVGKLIYLTLTHPDLVYAIHTLAQFMQTPRKEHREATIPVGLYLKGRSGQGILLHSNSRLLLFAFCDFDWATCPITRRSLL